MLRHQPKWFDDMQKKKPTNRYKSANSSPGISSHSTPGAPIDLAEDDVPNTGFVNLKKPPGRKVEKRKIRDHKNNYSESPIMDLLQEMKGESKRMQPKKNGDFIKET